jgi:hypothetical protein
MGAPSQPCWNFTGLTVLPSDDPREAAAERTASRIARARPTGAASDGTPVVGHSATGAIVRTPAAGAPLDDAARSFFERLFGWSFEAVRVHTDEAAARSAHALSAAAFTMGGDIAFARGRYEPGSETGRALLAHELTHVMQQAAGPPVLARQTVEQYETRGIPISRTVLERLAGNTYWDQKLYAYGFAPVMDQKTKTRLLIDGEELEAVLAVVFQMRPQPSSIAQDVTKVVTIPKRAAAGSRDVTYQITFEARPLPGNKENRVLVLFVAENKAASTVTADDPAPVRSTPAYQHGSFPHNDADKYWQDHPGEHRRVFNWIENTAPQHFDQVITTTTGNGASAQSASFHVTGAKERSGKVSDLIIVFLGSVTPSRQATPVDYASHDFADKGIEEAQTTLDPVMNDKLGMISGLDQAHAEEHAAVKFTILQYFQSDPGAKADPVKHRTGTRNAEVDAIVPIPGSLSGVRPRRVLYTFRFRANARDAHIQDVDIQRIGEEGVDEGVNVGLTPRGSLARVNGFSDHAKGATEQDRVTSLTHWLKQRYPGVTPAATATVAQLEKDVTAQIRVGSNDPKWYETNYGIKILTADDARAWLDKGLGYNEKQDIQDLQDFQPAELPLLEFVLERMSDGIVSTFQGVRLIRQKVYFDFNLKTRVFDKKERTAGVTRGETPRTRTITIFDAATDNPDALFLGGLGSSGRPATEPGSAQTFTHELGHVISYRPGVQKAFDKLVTDKQIKPITWYAASDPPKELFPEAFTLFYADPEWLKNNWPDLFDFFDALDKKERPRRPSAPRSAGKPKP